MRHYWILKYTKSYGAGAVGVVVEPRPAGPELCQRGGEPSSRLHNHTAKEVSAMRGSPANASRLYEKPGPFSVERLQMGPPFCSVVCVHTAKRRPAACHRLSPQHFHNSSIGCHHGRMRGLRAYKTAQRLYRAARPELQALAMRLLVCPCSRAQPPKAILKRVVRNCGECGGGCCGGCCGGYV